MKLKKSRMDGYICEITEELDQLSGRDQMDLCWRHYIYEFTTNERILAIRVPGGTVGGISLDDKGHITKIAIDTNYVVKTYPDDVEARVRKYIGERFEW